MRVRGALHRIGDYRLFFIMPTADAIEVVRVLHPRSLSLTIAEKAIRVAG
jgi:hypothetical protein